MTTELKKFYSAIESIDTAMMVTRRADGHLRARAMAKSEARRRRRSVVRDKGRQRQARRPRAGCSHHRTPVRRDAPPNTAAPRVMLMLNASVRPWVAPLVRLGYLAKGLIYSLIGVLAILVAFDMSGGRLTDASGVLRSVLRQPFGLALLAIIGIGIIGYAGYYLFEAIVDLRRKGGGVRGWSNRVLTMIKAVAYGTIGIEALNIVFFNPRPSGDAEDNARLVMRFPLGAVVIMLVGLGIAIYGVTQLKMAWDGGVDEDIDAARVRREAAWILPFGRFGTAARSVILILMGATLLWSGFQRRPSNADGYSEVLRTIASFDPWLLAAMGAGLLCFGLYQLCHARYAKIAIR